MKSLCSGSDDNFDPGGIDLEYEETPGTIAFLFILLGENGMESACMGSGSLNIISHNSQLNLETVDPFVTSR